MPPPKKTTIVAVLHPPKEQYDPDDPIELQVNVPLSEEGRKQAYVLIEPIKALGPFVALCSSPLMRALETASIVGLPLGLMNTGMFRIIPELAQMASFETHPVTREKISLRWPGHEHDDHRSWQLDAIKAVSYIHRAYYGMRVLAVGHRGPFGGLVAHARGITDVEGIKRVVREEKFAGERGVFIIEVGGEDYYAINTKQI